MRDHRLVEARPPRLHDGPPLPETAGAGFAPRQRRGRHRRRSARTTKRWTSPCRLRWSGAAAPICWCAALRRCRQVRPGGRLYRRADPPGGGEQPRLHHTAAQQTVRLIGRKGGVLANVCSSAARPPGQRDLLLRLKWGCGAFWSPLGPSSRSSPPAAGEPLSEAGSAANSGRNPDHVGPSGFA